MNSAGNCKSYAAINIVPVIKMENIQEKSPVLKFCNLNCKFGIHLKNISM